MKLERRARLETAGIDVAQALERMMGSEALLERLLCKFLEDENFSQWRAALDSGDSERAAAAAHALKGVCGNLSMTELFALFTEQVDALRRGDLTMARSKMDQIVLAYGSVVSAVREGMDAAR